MNTFKRIALVALSTHMIATAWITQKKVVPNSPTGRTMQALESFWISKFSNTLQAQCKASSYRCHELVQSMSAVVTATQRIDNAETEKTIQALTTNNATPHDIAKAEVILNTYGQATVVNNDLVELSSEYPKDVWCFNNVCHEMPTLFPFQSALSHTYSTIETMGKEQNWSEEQIAQEKNNIKTILLEFIQNKKQNA